MDYKILKSGSVEDLTHQVKHYILEGWSPKGSHQVVTTHSVNRYSGQRHMDTIHTIVYSQTIVKED